MAAVPTLNDMPAGWRVVEDSGEPEDTEVCTGVPVASATVPYRAEIDVVYERPRTELLDAGELTAVSAGSFESPEQAREWFRVAGENQQRCAGTVQDEGNGITSVAVPASAGDVPDAEDAFGSSRTLSQDGSAVATLTSIVALRGRHVIAATASSPEDAARFAASTLAKLPT